MNGLSDAMKGVAGHARSLVQLEVQLALSEMKRKVAALGIGIALALLAVLLLGLAVIFGLAAATVGVTHYLPVWESLLVMCGGLFLFALLLAAIGLALVRRGAKPLPEQAIDEARLTLDELQDEQEA